MWGRSQKQSLTQGPDNERGKLAARHRREPPAVAARRGGLILSGGKSSWR